MSSKVNGIINMVDAKAMITITTRAIAELKIGVFCIGLAAYGAFVTVIVNALLPPHFLRRSFEVDGLRGPLRFARTEIVQQFLSAENKEV